MGHPVIAVRKIVATDACGMIVGSGFITKHNLCSYQYDFLKISLKKIPITYPLGTSNFELFLTNKMTLFYMQFQPYLQTPEHIHLGHYKHVKKI